MNRDRKDETERNLFTQWNELNVWEYRRDGKWGKIETTTRDEQWTRWLLTFTISSVWKLDEYDEQETFYEQMMRWRIWFDSFDYHNLFYFFRGFNTLHLIRGRMWLECLTSSGDIHTIHYSTHVELGENWTFFENVLFRILEIFAAFNRRTQFNDKCNKLLSRHSLIHINFQHFIPFSVWH